MLQSLEQLDEGACSCTQSSTHQLAAALQAPAGGSRRASPPCRRWPPLAAVQVLLRRFQSLTCLQHTCRPIHHHEQSVAASAVLSTVN